MWFWSPLILQEWIGSCKASISYQNDVRSEFLEPYRAELNHETFVLQSQMPDPKTFKQHFESKHPKSPLPPELEGVEAWTAQTPEVDCIKLHNKSPDLKILFSRTRSALLPEFYTRIFPFTADMNPVDQRLMTFSFPLSTLFQSTCLGYDQISVLPQPALTCFLFSSYLCHLIDRETLEHYQWLSISSIDRQ